MRILFEPGKDGKAAKIPSTFLKQPYKDLVASVQGKESLAMAESRTFFKGGAKGTFLTATQLGKAVSIMTAKTAIYTKLKLAEDPTAAGQPLHWLTVDQSSRRADRCT